MTDTWKGQSSTSWFDAGNWNTGNSNTGAVPTISATGNQSVVISGPSTSSQPVISPFASGASDIYVVQTLTTGGQNYTSLLETQIGGELITLTNGANLTIQGIAMGVFYGNNDTITAACGTMSGLHGALSSTPSYDSHMQLIAIGSDTLTVDTINENFGLITIGSGDTLNIANITTGGNQQALHGLINYGLITVASGGDLNITANNGTCSGTVANFYNAGWIVDNGGTLNISSSVLDGANTAASATSIDGYIELEGGANAILSSTVASHEEVLFADTAANTLQITAGTLFGGTVAGFGATDTIIVNGFTSTSNATLVANGSTTNLITTNGSVQTTITLAGSISSGVATGANSSSKQEYIQLGGSTLSGGTTFGGGAVTLGGTSTPTLTVSGTIGVTGSTTDVVLNSSLSGNGTLFIDNGATLALDNTTGTDTGVTVLFGTHGTSADPNTLILNDNASGFGGKVNNFGVNDEIVIGSNVLAQPTAGTTGLALSYSSATGVLTVEDTSNSTGSIVSSTQVTISGTPAGTLSTSSFVALESGSGIDIELAPTAATSFTFSTSGTGSFEQASNFSGGTAPGDIITSCETVSIATGTASISSGGVSENGLITVANGAGFIDTGSLSGTGTLNVASGGSATLTGNTTLATISDAGTLVLGGNLGATGVTLTSNTSSITIASNFTDNGLINGNNGTVTVAKGATAAFNGGVTAASILDYGTIDIGNNALSSINMEGASGSKVAFTGTNTATSLTSFGGADDIVVGTAALASATSGGSVSLSYSGGKLSITEGSSKATITVAGTSSLSTSSFIALQGTDGVNIELVSGLAGQTFSFSTSGTGSFEAPADYTGGVAPGDSIVAGEVVTITAGTASVTGAALVDNGTINVGTNLIDTGSITGTGTLNVGSGASATLTGNTTLGSITDAGTLVLGGSDAVAITLASSAQTTIASNFSDTGNITGAGTLTVNSGVTATLAAGSSVASIIDAGTLALAGATGGVINMQGNGAKSVVDFTGSSSSATLTNFGTTDDIILGTGVLPTLTAGESIALSYNGSMLTVGEVNAGGTTVSSAHVTVSGVSGTTLSAASFVALQGTNGENIELASGLASQTFTFSTSGTGSFEAPADYTGGVAPGDSIVAGEVVTITAGTASVTGAALVDNGTINVGTNLIDTGSITGTGTLNVGSGASATLTGNTTLGSITDAGTLVLGGSDAVAITLASSAQTTIASNFSDTGNITGAGTLTVNSGVTATLAAGSSVASIIDAGTLALAGATGGVINMQGNGAKSVVDFTGSSSSATLTNFGTTDDIILGTGVLPTLTAGESIALSYNGSMLTVGEVNAGGTTVSSAHVTVSGVSGTTLSAASFVALQGTNGENIELASGLASQTFTFSTSGTGSFEAPADYTGGVAPGDSIVAGEVVTITAGTASVTGAALVDNGTINVGTNLIDTGSITGTGTLNVGSGASATLTGNTTLGSITDAGTLVLGGSDAVAITLASSAQTTIASNFSDTGNITGAGTLTVNSGVTATLAAGSSVASIIDAGTLYLTGAMDGVIDMEGNNADSVVDFSGTDVTNHVLNTTIANFGQHDTVVLGPSNFSLSSISDELTQSYTDTMLVVTDTTNGASVTINGSLADGILPGAMVLDESTGQLIIHLCFYPGTHIATPEGEVAVEALQAGDPVLTANGVKQVRWVGQSHVHTRFSDPLRSLPIRIKAGALGDGLPARDLLLSPDHAVFIDGILVQAAALVNGTSIVREQDVPEQFTYYHVELATHELLLAEGVQAESFVDNVDRMHFHNWDEREASAEAIEEMPYPRAKAARQVPMAIRRRLNGTAANAA